MPALTPFAVPASGGATLHGDAAGAGAGASGAGSPAVLFLHAGIADRGMWDPQVEAAALAARHRVLRYDLRGHGASAAPAGSFSHRADLATVLAHLATSAGVTRPVLVGASFGGRVALDHALAHPGTLAGLVLIGSAPSGFDRGAFPAAPELAEVEAAMAAGDLDRAAELEMRMWLVGPHRRDADVPAALRERIRAMDRVALATEAAGVAVEDPWPPAFDRLGELALPVLIVVGELDRPDVLAACRESAARIPGARPVTIPGTAHLPSLEAPERFNRVLLEFLAGV